MKTVDEIKIKNEVDGKTMEPQKTCDWHTQENELTNKRRTYYQNRVFSEEYIKSLKERQAQYMKKYKMNRDKRCRFSKRLENLEKKNKEVLSVLKSILEDQLENG